MNREALGQHVRETWIAWAKEQPAPKPSWLVPWEGLSEPDKEVDRRIGEVLYQEGWKARQDISTAMQLETKMRRAFFEGMTRVFYPEQFLGAGTDIDAVLRAVKKLAEDGKVTVEANSICENDHVCGPMAIDEFLSKATCHLCGYGMSDRAQVVVRIAKDWLEELRKEREEWRDDRAAATRFLNLAADPYPGSEAR